MDRKERQTDPKEIKRLEAQEGQIIADAMKKYDIYDPRQDEERHAQLLLTEYDGKKYRRFIIDCVELTCDNLSESQVRSRVTDVDYCQQELGPLIEKNGLQYLPFVTEGTASVYDVENGHHRIHYVLHLKGSDSIAVFVVGSNSYEIHEDGTYGIGARASYLNTVAAIKSNPPPSSKPYTVDDVAVQCARLFKQDPYLNGINPTGKFPERPAPNKLNPVFSALMDHLHPEQFLNARARGRIFNTWDSRRDGAKIKTVSFSDITDLVVGLGYDPGVIHGKRNGKASRKEFLDWYDENNKAYIAKTNTNGRNFEATVSYSLIEAYHEGVLHGDKDHKVVIFCEVYNPKPTLTGLDKQRQAFIEGVKKANSILIDTIGMPFGYAEVHFPKQLTTASDKGLSFHLLEDDINNVVELAS